MPIIIIYSREVMELNEDSTIHNTIVRLAPAVGSKCLVARVGVSFHGCTYGRQLRRVGIALGRPQLLEESPVLKEAEKRVKTRSLMSLPGRSAFVWGDEVRPMRVRRTCE
jgi:hypothetical protein